MSDSKVIKTAPSFPQQLRAMPVGETLRLPIVGTNYQAYMVARGRLQRAQVGQWTQEWGPDKKTLIITRNA